MTTQVTELNKTNKNTKTCASRIYAPTNSKLMKMTVQTIEKFHDCKETIKTIEQTIHDAS